MDLLPIHFLQKNLRTMAVSTAVIAVLSGCSSTSSTSTETAAQANGSSATDETIRKELGENYFSHDLLDNYLSGLIALQLNRPKFAVQALNNAAELSQDTTITAQAAAFADRVGDDEIALQLYQQLATENPQDLGFKLAIIRSQLKQDQVDLAMTNILDLVTQREAELTDRQRQYLGQILLQGSPTTPKITPARLEQWQAFSVERKDNALVNFLSATLASHFQLEDQYTSHLDAAIAADPNWALIHIIKLRDLHDENSEQVDSFAKSFIKRNPDELSFQIQYAQTLIDKEDNRKAKGILRKVLKADPDQADALLILGLVSLEEEDLDNAETMLLRYLEHEPQNDQVRLYLGATYEEAGNYKAAQQILNEVASREHYFEAQMRISSVINKRKDADAAIRFLRSVDVRSDTQLTTIYIEIEQIYQSENQLESALRTLDEGLELLPDSVQLKYNRGLLFAMMNNVEGHEKDLRELLQDDPKNPNYLNALGYTLADLTNRYDEALELIEMALAISPNDAYIIDSYGWVLFRKGQHEAAIEQLQKAMKIQPNAEIAAHLGEAYWVVGKQKQAKKVWAEGLKLNPKNSVLLQTMERFLDSAHSLRQNQPPLLISGIVPNSY